MVWGPGFFGFLGSRKMKGIGIHRGTPIGIPNRPVTKSLPWKWKMGPFIQGNVRLPWLRFACKVVRKIFRFPKRWWKMVMNPMVESIKKSHLKLRQAIWHQPKKCKISDKSLNITRDSPEMKQTKHPWRTWWLNQLIWKKYAHQFGSFPPGSGFRKKWNRHLLALC